MKFSIIIPARNEEGYIAKTLLSIENQDFPDYEKIVVANGCTDNTVFIAKKYADQVIELSEPGVSRARNAGAAKAQGEILVFLDADTVLEEKVLKEINESFNQNYTVGTVRVKPDLPKFRYKTMMHAKNLVNHLRLYSWMSGILYCRKADFLPFDEKLNIKENHFFIEKMKEKGQFYFLKTAYVQTSMRRYEKWGSSRLIWFFIRKGLKSVLGNVEGDKYPVIR